MQEGERYYQADNDIKNRKITRKVDGHKEEETWRANNKLAHAKYKIQVDEKIAYLLTKPVTYKTDGTDKNDTYVEKVKDVLGKHFQYQLTQLGYEASNKGMAKISAEKITDDEQALKVADLYDLWSGDGVAYKTGKYITYQDALYKVLQNHTSQADWAPDTASSLYAKVLTDPTGKVLPWEQPNSTNPYKKGDRVTHKGKTWESLVDSNVWEPGAVGSESLWKEVA